MAPGILHVVDSLNVGGMERVVMTLANRLQQRGWPQTVCCLRQAGTLAQSLSGEVRLVEMGSKGRQWNLVGRLRHLADQCRPDLVHGQNLSTWCDVVRAFADRYPTIQSFHGLLSEKLPLPQRMLARRLAGRTQRLLAVSEPLGRDMARHLKVAADRIEVIPNGIDTAYFAPRQRGLAAHNIRAWAGNRLLCVTVASLTPAKSPQTLLQAARRLPEKVAFIWVGAGPLENELRRQIKEADLQERFQLVGFRSDVRPFLQVADLFVLPSQSEALPLSVLEAQSSGLPVVATRVGSLPDLVPEPQTGLLAEPGNPDALAGGIKIMLDQPATLRRMGRAARDHVVRRFDIERMIDRYQAVYESLAGQRAELVGAR